MCYLWFSYIQIVSGKEYAFYDFVCADSIYHKILEFEKYSNHNLQNKWLYPLLKKGGIWGINIKLFGKFSNREHLISAWHHSYMWTVGSKELKKNFTILWS